MQIIRYFLALLLLLAFITCAQYCAAASKPLQKQNSIAADFLDYDETKQIMKLTGHVKIAYNNYLISCESALYNKKKHLIIARGDVNLIDAKGNKIQCSCLTLKQTTQQAIIQNIKAETTGHNYFNAKSAQHIKNGRIIILKDALYTACESCDTNLKIKACDSKYAEKPLWYIKAKKVVWDRQARTLAFHNSEFNFLQHNIIELPNFSLMDYSVKRLSGFLPVNIGYNGKLGYSLTIPYFINLAPDYDLTLALTKYSLQGLMWSAKWRQAMSNGSYDFILHSIRQEDKSSFAINSIDSQQNRRFMLGSKAQYDINPHWKYGWNIFYQTDADFSKSYNIKDYNKYSQLSNIYLTGINGLNYFNLELLHFNIQSKDVKQQEQPYILPNITYEYRLGSDVQINSYFHYIYHPKNPEKSYSHLSSEASWQKQFVTKQGLVLSPLVALRLDAVNKNSISSLATSGLEIKYPLLIKTAKGRQILEPLAQIYVRNNLKNNSLAGKSEQNFIFDSISLWQRDKNTDFDFIEYGSRANLGFRYQAKLSSDLRLYALFGQSFALSQANPYRDQNYYNLSKNCSDYVSSFALTKGANFSVSLHNILDSNNFTIKESQVEIFKQFNKLSLYGYYSNAAKLPQKGYVGRQLAGYETWKLNDFWSFALSQNIDLSHHKLMSIGAQMIFKNDCFYTDIGYSYVNPLNNATHIYDKGYNKFNLHFSLRNLMNFNH